MRHGQNWFLSFKRTLNLDTGLGYSLYSVSGRTSSREKILTLIYQRAYCRAHVAALFVCPDCEWESLGKKGHPPKPCEWQWALWGEHWFVFSFSCFHVSWPLWERPILESELWNQVPLGVQLKKQFHHFLPPLSLKSCSSILKLQSSINLPLPGASHNTQWFLFRYIREGAGYNTGG